MRTPVHAGPDFARDPVAFIDTFIPLNEKGKPWRLSPHQRRVLRRAFTWAPVADCPTCPPDGCLGHLTLRLFVWGEMKKSGKTFIAACLALWWGVTHADSEIIIAANDLEQSTGRVFKTMAKLATHNAPLARIITVRAQELQLSNGTTVTAIAADYRGAAGSRHSLYCVDEPWGFTLERAERLIEELTPPPSEPDAWGLWTTTAGWVGESQVLERAYQRGLTGIRLDDDLELYRADDLTMFWSHTPRQPWQTRRYYDEQRRSLRPNTFARLHDNQWVTAESTFITPELWDAAVEPTLTPQAPDRRLVVYVGVDAATKRDTAAVVCVARDTDDHVVLVRHRIWTPTPGQPVDLEATVEAFIRQVCTQYTVAAVLVDPYQMARSIATLTGLGLPVLEWPQTVATVTKMGSVLYDLLRDRQLRVYPDSDLRQQALNTVAVESERGFKITKVTSARKVDAIVALSMACVAALEFGTVGPGLDPEVVAEQVAADATLERQFVAHMGGDPSSTHPLYVAPDHPGAYPQQPYAFRVDATGRKQFLYGGPQ